MNYTKKLSNYCFERIESLNKTKVVLKWSFGEDTVGMCTCTMDQFFRYSRDNTDELRCFYLLGSLIDQTIFTHFQELYKEFRISLKFPKIFQHGLSTVMASPSIFFEVRVQNWENDQFETKEVNWDTMKTVAENLFEDCKNWLKESNNESVISPFNDKIMEEINNKENGFQEPNKSQLLKLLKAIND